MTYTPEYKLIVLQPQGRLNLQGGEVLGQQLAELKPSVDELWVIDFAQVDFMDSSGLFTLVTGLKAARQYGCRLVLCNMQPSVRLIFELTQLDSVFEIFASYDAVLSTVNRSVLVAKSQYRQQ